MSENHFPAVDLPLLEGRQALSLPIARVTLLEDRAQVRRVADVSLAAGLNRFVVADVAPVLQDVSLVAAVAGLEGSKVADVRARRALRVKRSEKPEVIGALEREIKQKAELFRRLAEDRLHAERRMLVLEDMIDKGLREVPEDAAWGLVNQQAWRDTFEALFRRTRELGDFQLEKHFAQVDLAEDVARLAAQRTAADRPDLQFAAWIELDLVASAGGTARVEVEYVVPNALWRPMHSARLSSDGTLRLRSSAAVWQNTGEDWTDVELLLSTARSSLGTEPPLLTDDLLRAQKKSEQVVVALRDVAIQKASPGGRDAAPEGVAPHVPRGVELPGVDDGGDVQTLHAKGRCRIPSDGRPNVIPLGEVTSPAERSLVVFPELEEKAFLEVRAANTGPVPLLAGPVELVRDYGFVGWTKLLFVAPKERFVLGFGPDDAIRVSRRPTVEEEVSDVDKWRTSRTTVSVYLSNLSGDEKTLRLAERIPVSELREVKVALDGDKTKKGVAVDDDGICTWKLVLGPNDHQRVKLVWSMSVAPGVEGI